MCQRSAHIPNVHSGAERTNSVQLSSRESCQTNARCVGGVELILETRNKIRVEVQDEGGDPGEHTFF